MATGMAYYVLRRRGNENFGNWNCILICYTLMDRDAVPVNPGIFTSIITNKITTLFIYIEERS